MLYMFSVLKDCMCIVFQQLRFALLLSLKHRWESSCWKSFMTSWKKKKASNEVSLGKPEVWASLASHLWELWVSADRWAQTEIQIHIFTNRPTSNYTKWIISALCLEIKRACWRFLVWKPLLHIYCDLLAYMMTLSLPHASVYWV